MSEKVKIKIARNVVHLPAIALRGLVVFPNNVVHFEVGRTKSIAAIEAAMHANSSVFLDRPAGDGHRRTDHAATCTPTVSLPRSSRCCASPTISSKSWSRARPAPACWNWMQGRRILQATVRPVRGARHRCRQAQPGRSPCPQPERLLRGIPLVQPADLQGCCL